MPPPKTRELVTADAVAPNVVADAQASPDPARSRHPARGRLRHVHLLRPAEVEHLAPAHELGGLAIPYLLELAGPPLGYPAALLLLALAAPLTTLLLAVQGRRHPPAAKQKKPTQNSSAAPDALRGRSPSLSASVAGVHHW